MSSSEVVVSEVLSCSVSVIEVTEDVGDSGVVNKVKTSEVNVVNFFGAIF